MSKKKFSYLLQKYLDNQCSEQEKKLVESWFSLLDDEERWERFNKENLKLIEQKLWDRLQSSIHKAEAQPSAEITDKKVFRLQPMWRVAAAIVFLLVGAGIVYQLTSKPIDTAFAENGWIKKVNETSGPLAFTLEDGSTLQLASGATAYYPEHFSANRRELKIEGTAFFQIAKDTSRPFYVHTQQLVTRVLGTSFWVIYDKVKQESAVEVVSGKVAVYKNQSDSKTNTKAEGVVLKPNEKVIFNNKEEVFITALVDSPVSIRPDTVKAITTPIGFIYEETPFSKVAKDLEAEYGISIILGSEDMNELLFTGNISSLDYFTKLKTICKSLGAAYETKGNRILIERK